jgi:beta-N-acetylhexosaminidase
MGTSDRTGRIVLPAWGPRRHRWLAVGVIGLVITFLTAACGASASPAGSSAQPSGSPRLSLTAGSTAGSTAGTTSPAQDACVTTTMANMTPQQLVGQLMMVGTPIANPASVDKLIRTYGIGGVFLSGRSHQTASQLSTAIAALQASAPAGVGLLIALDQEGGEVQTLQGADFPPIPTALAQGRLSQSALHTQVVAWSGRLAAIGVSMDLAPVADTVPTSIGTRNPPIGAFDREYGSDPTAVAADIATVVAAAQSTGVLVTLKHFPGLGRVLKNTDTATGAVDTVATTHDPYLAPFAAGIRAGAGAVMMSSASYPNLDPHAVAAFSAPIVTGLLRQQLGFGGLIVSDDLGAAAAVSAVPVGQRGVRFVDAGGDLVLTVAPATAASMIDGLVAAAQASPVFTAKVQAAARQILRTKYAAHLLPCSLPK